MIEGREPRKQPQIATDGINVTSERVGLLKLASELLNEERQVPTYVIVSPEDSFSDTNGMPLTEGQERILIQGEWTEEPEPLVYPLWDKERAIAEQFGIIIE